MRSRPPQKILSMGIEAALVSASRSRPGRKVFIVLYRAGGAGSRLRKYTFGPYGRVTLHQARAAALRIFAARTEGRDPAAEKQLERRRLVVDGVDDLVELFISEHVSKTRSAREISQLLRREVIPCWGTRSVHEISKRQVIEMVTEMSGCGTPSAANKLLKTVKGFRARPGHRSCSWVSSANWAAAPGSPRRMAAPRIGQLAARLRSLRPTRGRARPRGRRAELAAISFTPAGRFATCFDQGCRLR